VLSAADNSEFDPSTALHVDAQLSKPVLDDELRATLRRLVRREHCHTVERGHPDPDQLVGPVVNASTCLHIVVAEDNEFNSQLMSELLTRRGHDVCVARTGNEALRLVEGGGCDLLLLDVHMPELDGFQIIRAIRQLQQPGGRRLPVVAVTARSRVEDRDRCLNAGMDDYLPKPVNAASLWAAIDRRVPRQR
jgi:CheY-like chemotaxis protein